MSKASDAQFQFITAAQLAALSENMRVVTEAFKEIAESARKAADAASKTDVKVNMRWS